MSGKNLTYGNPIIDIYVKTKSYTCSEVQLTESSAEFVPSI